MDDRMNIQWYPGHMTKTRRNMEADLKLVDAVCEIDTERMARVLLEEYRSCKIGRFTLEDPPERTEACATN